MNRHSFAVLIFFLINYFLTFLIIGLLAGVLSLINKPKPLRINVVAEALFAYYLLFTIGINHLVNFVAHVFFGDFSAEFIGWPQSPFQAEVGFASLGVGIAGVIAFKASLPFRVATLIPPSAFSLGAAGGHIYQMIVAKNFSPGNVGVVLPSGILIPVVGFVLLWLSYKHPQPRNGVSRTDIDQIPNCYGFPRKPAFKAPKRLGSRLFLNLSALALRLVQFCLCFYHLGLDYRH